VADGLARLDRDVLSYHPAIAIVELGSNDPGHTPLASWTAGLEEIVQRLQAHGIHVILGGLDEPGMADAYRQVAARFGVPLVWFTNGLWSRPGLWGDAHHPNGAGYQLVMENFWPAVAEYLSRP
jgi:lysophospholipase L1-like esterase